MNRITDTLQLRELQEGSGISAEVIEHAGLFTCDDARVLGKFRLLVAKAWTNEYRPALLFPYYEPDKKEPRFYAAKPRVPFERQEKNGAKSSMKYVRPSGDLYCYLPPNVRTGRAISDAATPLLVTEGEKKALSACSHGFHCIALAGVHTWGRATRKAPPRFDGWGVKDHDGIKRLFEPLAVAAASGREIFIVFDSDAATNLVTVRPAEIQLAIALTAAGAKVYIVRLPEGDGEKVGLDDFLVRHGAAALRALMQEAREEGPAVDAKQAQYLRRPEVVISTNHEATTIAALKALKDAENLYQRGGSLVRIVAEPATSKWLSENSGAPRIELAPESDVDCKLTEAASLIEPDKEGIPRPKHTPAWLLKSIVQRGEWEYFGALTGVIEAPVIRDDGSLLLAPGYDEQSGLAYLPRSQPPNVPHNPTRADVEHARAELERVFADFPFKGPEHLSALIASLFTIVCRYAFNGPAPLFLLDASTPGSGKSLAASLIARIATGRRPSKYQWSREEPEQRKLITTIAVAGDRVVALDNIIGEFGGAALCDALTATDWRDRILSTNTSFSGPLLSVWFATGNNVQLGPDMHRRVCHIRLEPSDERPEERTGFAIADIEHVVGEQHATLLRHALTILRAYHVAGRPSVSMQPWGSYEAWSRAVRAPLIWAGWTDPAATRTELISSACLVDSAATRLVRGWAGLQRVIGECTAGRGHKAIFDSGAADTFTDLREAIEELSPRACESPKALGKLLAAQRGKVRNGLALQNRSLNGGLLWSVIGREGAAIQAPAGEMRTEPGDFVEGPWN